MQAGEPTVHNPRAEATNPTQALLNVGVTLVFFLASFIGFLIAPWLVLAIAALAYTLRTSYLARKSGTPVKHEESDGALKGFGLGASR